MSNSHVLSIQVSPLDKYSCSLSHFPKKQDWSISGKSSQSRPACLTRCLEATISNEVTDKFSFNAVSASLFLEQLAVEVQERKGFHDEGQQRTVDENFKASCAIRKLSSFGFLEEANEVFHCLQHPDAYAWSAIISAHSNLDDYAQAVKLSREMINVNAVPDGHVLLAVLKACSGSFDLELGMHIHCCSLKYGFDSDVYLNNALLNMYAKIGNLEDACLIFNKLTYLRDVVTWSTLIQAYSEHGYCMEAYELVRQMQKQGVQPNEFTLVCVLEACSNAGEIEYGEQMHLLVIEHGFECNLFIQNTVMDMYVKCDRLEDAKVLLNKFTRRDVVTWTIIMAGLAEKGLFKETFLAFQTMQENCVKPDHLTYACLAKACQCSEHLSQRRLVHSLIIESGMELHHHVGAALVEMYTRCESIADAYVMYCRMPEHDLSILNSIMCIHSQYEHSEKARQILVTMKEEDTEPDNRFFECFVRACSVLQDLEKGMAIHCKLIKLGMESCVRIGNALIEMYCRCGVFEEACNLFESSELDVVTWNIIIAQHAQTGQDKKAMVYFERMQSEGFAPNQVTWNALITAQYDVKDAIQLFWSMQQAGFAPNKITCVSLLQICCKNGCIEQGLHLHSHIIKTGLDVELAVQNTLIDIYAKNSNLETACLIFDKLPKRDIVSWNVLISGHTVHGDPQKSLALLQRMEQDSIDPNKITYVSMLQICANIAGLEHGRNIHDQLVNNGFELDIGVGNTLIDFYMKCGAMEDAHVILNRLPERDEVTWSTVISGHAKQCDYNFACQCFADMQSEMLEPNGGVFLSLLSACSHACLLHEGCFHFTSMQYNYGIAPCIDHLMVLVELFGNAGCLEEAEELLEILPWKSIGVGWMSLLGSCKKHRSIELAKRCFDHLMILENNSSSRFVLLSNAFAHAGLDEAIEDVVGLKKHVNAWKQPAKAYIEIDNQIHEFVIGDTSHSRSKEIYSKLRTLLKDLKEGGYRPSVGVGQKTSKLEQEESSLWAHSEKLALSLGLISTPEGTTIRVAKNLRMCVDCHDVAKLVSKKEQRDIIIKDSYCIHHFKDGQCCCVDL